MPKSSDLLFTAKKPGVEKRFIKSITFLSHGLQILHIFLISGALFEDLKGKGAKTYGKITEIPASLAFLALLLQHRQLLKYIIQ